jgi:cytochrome c biogenesis protein CcmG/thiol:disulfide interchange protein DsbE
LIKPVPPEAPPERNPVARREVAPFADKTSRGVVWRGLQAGAAALVLVLLAVLVWSLVHQGSGGRLVRGIRENERPAAPGFRLSLIWPHFETWPAPLRALEQTVALASLRGHPVVLNFWASWCVPCRSEAPQLAASARRYAGRVVFLAINVQDLRGPARHFLQRFHVPYVSVHDGSSTTYSAYGLTGLPETYYIDARGRILAHDIGEVDRAELERGIATIYP